MFLSQQINNSKKHMKIIHKTGMFVVQIALSLLCTFILFISVPAIHSLFENDRKTQENKVRTQTVLMEIVQKKPEQKKVQESRPRTVETSYGVKQSRSSAMKFNPDLQPGTGSGVAIQESNFENVVFKEGETDENAIPISRTPVPYPRRAKEAGIEGIAEMILLIDRNGNVAAIDFIHVPHPMFKQPIIDVVKGWKFKPAMNKGIAVQMRVRQNIEFSLE